MTFGLTTDGFVQKTLADLKTEIENALKASFGTSIDLSPQSVFGQFVGVCADRLADLWSLGGSIHAAFTPDGASGTSLDDLCAITGTVRLPASHSTVSVSVAGTPATVIPDGSFMTTGIYGSRWVLNGPVVLAAAGAWVTTTAYAAATVLGGFGDTVTRGGNIYVCTVSGTSGAGPSGTGTAIVDGTCTWRFLGTGTGTANATAHAESYGPVTAVAFDLNTIASPYSGWTGVINSLDAVLGTLLETDAALRIRREAEIRTAGKASVDAIRAALLAVSGVSSATVFENTTDVVDVNGVPPHAVECLVIGGTNAAVAASIFDEKAAGVATYGSTTVSVNDSAGSPHAVNFSRPTEIPIYVIFNLTVDLLTWPVDGAAQVKAALVAWGNAQKAGKDAVSAGCMARAFSIAGVLDGVALIGGAPAPTLTTTIPISIRQIATWDTGRITVNAVGGTP